MLSYNRKAIKAWAKSHVSGFWEKRISAVIVAIFAVFGFFVFDVVKMLVVMIILILLGIASMMYNRWVKVSLGFELIMFSTVVSGMLYCPVAAFVVGTVSLFFAEILTNRFTYSTFVSFFGILAVAFFIPLFEGRGITSAGIFLTLIYDLVIGPGYLVMGSSVWRTFLFIATHILFNIWVFVFIAPFVFRILQG